MRWQDYCYERYLPYISIVEMDKNHVSVMIDVDLIHAGLSHLDFSKMFQALLGMTDHEYGRRKLLANSGSVSAKGVYKEKEFHAARRLRDMFFDAAAAGRVAWRTLRDPPPYAGTKAVEDIQGPCGPVMTCMADVTPRVRDENARWFSGTGVHMREATVQLIEDDKTGSTGVVTDAETCEEFMAQCARVLADRIASAPDGLEARLRALLPQMFEVACNLKGYKADVRVRKLIIAGDFSPDAFAKAGEIGPGLRVASVPPAAPPPARPGNGRTVAANP
jgi:hypothetical protein